MTLYDILPWVCGLYVLIGCLFHSYATKHAKDTWNAKPPHLRIVMTAWLILFWPLCLLIYLAIYWTVVNQYPRQ